MPRKAAKHDSKEGAVVPSSAPVPVSSSVDRFRPVRSLLPVPPRVTKRRDVFKGESLTVRVSQRETLLTPRSP